MSPTRTFIIPGSLLHLSQISAYLNEEVCGILIHEHMKVSEARRLAVDASRFVNAIYTLDSLTELTPEELDASDWPLYDRCLHALMGDPRVHYLAARTYINSAFNNAIVIDKILVNSILIIRRTNPGQLISSSTPHSVEAWVFAKCFEYLRLPVLILERSPINNRAWIYQGMDTQEVVLRAQRAANGELTEYSRNLIVEQRNARPGARDKHGFYVSRMDMSSVKGSNASHWWSYMREARILLAGSLITLPLRILSVYVKRRLYRSYRDVEVKELPATPFVIYFMHYQPERSSLPEGLFHVQQWTAIRLLSLVLPKGWTLLVREHPTTWLLPLDIGVRTLDLYEQLSALPNTRVCSMDLDTFEIIDRCCCVATLTGSVGFQGILRNRPVIAFGLPAYKDHPACLSVHTATELVDAFAAIQKDNLSACFSDDALHEYLLWVEQNSVCADANEVDWLEARLKNFAELYRELLGRDPDPQPSIGIE